jgi:DNA-directed RNA polymerase subunit beta'
MAYEQQQVELHAKVWVRFDGQVEGLEQEGEPLQVERGNDGTVTKQYKERRVREDAGGNLISQFIRTTPGRIIYNKAIQEVLQ